MDIDASKYGMTEEELNSLKKFKESGNKYLEKDGKEILTILWSEPFSDMLQSFGFITEKLDFSKPFQVIVDYDPEQKRTVIHHYAPSYKADIEAYISGESDGGNGNQEPGSYEKPAVLKERLDRLEQMLQANRKNLSEAELDTKYKAPYKKLLKEIADLKKCLGISGNHQ